VTLPFDLRNIDWLAPDTCLVEHRIGVARLDPC
jgi:hypothetical protein